MVLKMTVMSTGKLCSRAYRTSRSRLSSEVSAERMDTWEKPVIPGFTLSRCLWYSLIPAICTGYRGRGPTMLISPFKTLKNWGNSSKEYSRRNFPALMSRGSFPDLGLKSYGLTLSFMLLNLKKTKGFPCWPIRSCLKRAGPLSLNLTIRAITIKRGEARRMKNTEKKISKSRLEMFFIQRGPYLFPVPDTDEAPAVGDQFKCSERGLFE